MNEKHDKLDLSDPFFSYDNQLKRFNDLKYKHTNTLKNKLNIKSESKLAIKEENIVKIKTAMLIEQKENVLDQIKLETEDDKINFLKGINKFIYEDLYDFAGKFRTVDFVGTTKDDLQHYIEPMSLENFDLAFNEVFQGFNKNYYERCSLDQKVALFSFNMSKLFDIQPFYKGNAITTIIFSQQFAERELGLDIDLNKLLLNDLNELFALAHGSDLKPLMDAMNECISEPHKYDKLFEEEHVNEEIEEINDEQSI
ncbi:hypothetical protein [Faecalibacillus intestinalis]|uniref:hypothetical protein n=1 Tax=Faecalibacillus intestinalis TaxID=1982626 RepID=UPI0022E24C13|nr:hypothetical protein [Faecalibacillus intestinalis]